MSAQHNRIPGYKEVVHFSNMAMKVQLKNENIHSNCVVLSILVFHVINFSYIV